MYTTSDRTAQKKLYSCKIREKLCSKSGEDRSINNVTILSTEAGWTLDTGHVYVITYSVQCNALERQKKGNPLQVTTKNDENLPAVCDVPWRGDEWWSCWRWPAPGTASTAAGSDHTTSICHSVSPAPCPLHRSMNTSVHRPHTDT